MWSPASTFLRWSTLTAAHPLYVIDLLVAGAGISLGVVGCREDEQGVRAAGASTALSYDMSQPLDYPI